MPGIASPSPAPQSTICRKNRICSASRNTLAYVEAGFSADAADDRHRALYLLKELGLSGREDPASLSGGEARRAALARALTPSPDILLLDEPTNHLDLPGIEWLEHELAEMRSGIVLISHDRRLLERLSRTTIWLDRGITRTLDEGFKTFEPWRDATLDQEVREQRRLGRKIAMEEDWLRYGVTARRTRNQRRLAELHALRRKRREQHAPPRARSGWKRLRPTCPADWSRSRTASPNLTGVAWSCGIFRRGSCAATRSASSALTASARRHCSTGALMPDTGEVRLGNNLAQVTLDQRRETLDPEQSLTEALTDSSGDTVAVRGQSRRRRLPSSTFTTG